MASWSLADTLRAMLGLTHVNKHHSMQYAAADSMRLVQFGTNFEEMDAFKGRGQTTKGIWLARSTKISSPPTLVMDLEGSDGRERGEDDTSFERQSSLFALAIADVLVINIWAKDIGRETGSGKPLLKTVFQVSKVSMIHCSFHGHGFAREKPMTFHGRDCIITICISVCHAGQSEAVRTSTNPETHCTALCIPR